MDINNLIETSRARFDHETAKRVLKEKYQAKMIFGHAGGMWRAAPDLICLLQSCPDETSVIEDLYSNPIKINVPDMLMLAQQRWQEQMNAWLTEYENLSQNR